jgi:hypothetical protein
MHNAIIERLSLSKIHNLCDETFTIIRVQHRRGVKPFKRKVSLVSFTIDIDI